MPTKTPDSELPKSLQALISDAQNAVTNSTSDDDFDVETGPGIQMVLDATKKLMEHLSRGEVDEYLYWECVAQDREEEGDWEAAAAAYQRIVMLPANDTYTIAKAHSSLGFLRQLLGDYKEALVSYHVAGELCRLNLGIISRLRYNDEAKLLVYLGRLEEAQAVIDHARSTFEEGHSDYLTWSQLLITFARCNFAKGNRSEAQLALADAWKSLEVLRTQYGPEGMKDAYGILAAYQSWWTTEATRCRLADDKAGEIDALRRAREEAAYCAGQTSLPRASFEYSLMHCDLALAGAFARHGRHDEATATRKLAEEIRTRRRFPQLEPPLSIAELEELRKQGRTGKPLEEILRRHGL